MTVDMDSEKIETGTDGKTYLVRKLTERTEITLAGLAQTKAQLEDHRIAVAKDLTRCDMLTAEIKATAPK